MAAYKIIGFSKETGAITVLFDEKMAPLSIDVPLNEDGLYITGGELDTFIKGFIPTWHLERVNKIAAGIANDGDIEALVEKLPVVEVSPEQPTPGVSTDVDQWQQQETEKLIAHALVKFGLLKEIPAL